MKKYRHFPLEFKERIVQEIESGFRSKAAIAREEKLSSSLIDRWEKQYREGTLRDHPTVRERQMARELDWYKKKVAEQAMEIDLLKKAVLPTKQTRSKYGPSLRMSYVVSFFIAYPGRSDTPALVAAPCRFYSAWPRLPRSENQGSAGASDLTFPFPSIACHWPYSGFRTAAFTLFLHRALRPSPLW
jgi:transposase-like protein